MAKKNRPIETPIEEIVEPIKEVLEEIKEEPVVETDTFIKINVPRLNVRAEANIDSEIIAVVEESDILRLKNGKKTTGFYQVVLSDGRIGFVVDKYVSKE